MGAENHAIPYEPYHPHLGYTLLVTLVAWVAIFWYSRWALHTAPRARVALLGLVIALPVLAELGSLLIFYLRPHPETWIGAILAYIHAFYIQRVPIDTFLAPRVYQLLIGGLLTLLLISLVRFAIGSWRLRALLRLAGPLSTRLYGALLDDVRGIAQAEGLRLAPIAELPLNAPIAFTSGLLRPRIYLSTALLELLNDDELLAVICHELAHVQRRDTLWNWGVRLLRDVTWFLPLGHAAWRMMVNSQDEACDALAARYTAEPLALARALVKVAGAGMPLAPPSAALMSIATPFAAHGDVQARVAQMIAMSDGDAEPRALRRAVFGAYLLGVLLLFLSVLPALLGS